MNQIRHIAHFDLDSFFVSVEILNNPALKGKPVVVGGKERGVVAAASYEARKLGIHSAMPIQKALQRYPDLIITNAARADYSRYSKWVTNIIAQAVPQFEKASIDEFYVDFTGMDKYFGITNYAQDLRKKITQQTGLPISCGLASARFIAKMATNEAKPNGFLQIEHGKELEFLWPLAIEKINGVGAHTEQQLKTFGIYTIKDIAHTPIEVMERIAGKSGVALWHKAHGKGSAAIATDWEQKSISHENTFFDNLTDRNELITQLVRLTEKTAFSLREEEKMAGCITLKIRYNDFETFTKQVAIDYTALDDVLIAQVKKLFSEFYQKGRPVRLLGVRLSQLIPLNIQMNLFDDHHEKIKLYKTVDAIKNQFGKSLLTKASIITPKKSND